MAKYELRIKARKMREKGQTLQSIAGALSVTKSTVSLWCRDIILPKELIEKINKNQNIKLIPGRLKAAQVNRQKKIDAIDRCNTFAKKFIKNINKRELGLIAAALYWSEGSKSPHTAGFQFINSDPDMILAVRYFLEGVMEVKNNEIKCSIQINITHEKRIGKVLSFWKNLLNLRDEQMRKPYYVRTKASKVYDNYDNYYGICRLMVSKSSLLKYKMLGMIEEMKKKILSG
ncbi:MAG: hypothetical protein RL641_221 [Candidatus Parcubacteria bacterium]|jgi:predicted transcriptional regulator